MSQREHEVGTVGNRRGVVGDGASGAPSRGSWLAMGWYWARTAARVRKGKESWLGRFQGVAKFRPKAAMEIENSFPFLKSFYKSKTNPNSNQI
jgi:hypothetical protein